MQLFLDTANIEEIEQGVRMGITGVTTNPSLVSKEGKVDYKGLVQQICDIVPGPVSTEVLSLDAAGMIAEARDIATWAENVVVKIPASEAGIEATRQLSSENIKVNLTLCFSVNQALLGAAAGAVYVSPFVGRLDDIGEDGMGLIRDIVEVYRNYPDTIRTKVLAASIRHPRHCVEAARAGAPVMTLPFKVLLQMTRHPLTDTGIKRFLDDWHMVMGDNAAVK